MAPAESVGAGYKQVATNVVAEGLAELVRDRVRALKPDTGPFSSTAEIRDRNGPNQGEVAAPWINPYSRPL